LLCGNQYEARRSAVSLLPSSSCSARCLLRIPARRAAACTGQRCEVKTSGQVLKLDRARQASRRRLLAWPGGTGCLRTLSPCVCHRCRSRSCRISGSATWIRSACSSSGLRKGGEREDSWKTPSRTTSSSRRSQGAQVPADSVYKAAQAVQRSADGTAYIQYQQMAASLTGLHRSDPRQSVLVQRAYARRARIAAADQDLTRAFGPLRYAPPGTEADRDRAAPGRGLSVAAWLVSHASRYGIRDVRTAATSGGPPRRQRWTAHSQEPAGRIRLG